MFKTYFGRYGDRSKGNFSIKFPNGYTVSLAMGDGLFSTGNPDQGFGSVEVAAWDSDGNWVKLSDDNDVIGWQTPEQVLAIMNKIAAL